MPPSFFRDTTKNNRGIAAAASTQRCPRVPVSTIKPFVIRSLARQKSLGKNKGVDIGVVGGCYVESVPLLRTAAQQHAAATTFSRRRQPITMTTTTATTTTTGHLPSEEDSLACDFVVASRVLPPLHSTPAIAVPIARVNNDRRRRASLAPQRKDIRVVRQRSTPHATTTTPLKVWPGSEAFGTHASSIVRGGWKPSTAEVAWLKGEERSSWATTTTSPEKSRASSSSSSSSSRWWSLDVLLSKYAKALETRPLTYKCITSAFLGGVGDLCSQGVYWARDGDAIWHNRQAVRRTLAVAIDGFCFNAPLLHYAYDALERWMPTDENVSNAFLQVAIDVLILDPAYALLFIVTTGLLEGLAMEGDIIPMLKADYATLALSLMAMGLVLAPPQIYLFKRFALKWRVLIADIIDLLWTFLACLVMGSNY